MKNCNSISQKINAFSFSLHILEWVIGMLDRMSEYIQDKEFRFTVYENKIYFVNYKRIIILEDDYVLLQSSHKKISIKGKDLVLSKLLDKEMLLSGVITNIEVEYE